MNGTIRQEAQHKEYIESAQDCLDCGITADCETCSARTMAERISELEKRLAVDLEPVDRTRCLSCKSEGLELRGGSNHSWVQCPRCDWQSGLPSWVNAARERELETKSERDAQYADDVWSERIKDLLGFYERQGSTSKSSTMRDLVADLRNLYDTLAAD